MLLGRRKERFSLNIDQRSLVSPQEEEVGVADLNFRVLISLSSVGFPPEVGPKSASSRAACSM